MYRLIFILAVFFLTSIGCKNDQSQNKTSNSSSNYLERLQKFSTNLSYPGPSPQDWKDETPPPNTSKIHYQSGDLSLKAWLYKPPNKEPKYPALVYLHGGFAFGSGDLMACKPFMSAGYVVMCPMFRGENGNPGNFELMLGEVEDAKAAIQWIANQPYIDQNRIFAFGHSSGGAIAALLSLRADVPVQHTGSSGGLYSESVFDSWKDFVPFDLSNKEERNLRVLIGNISDMQFPHYAFIGKSDVLVKEINSFRREMKRLSETPKLTIFIINGDHFSSLKPAMENYLSLIEEEYSSGMQTDARSSRR